MKNRTITINIIRHGEKPDVPKGSTEKYSGLTAQGGARAMHYFSGNFIKDTFGGDSYDIYTYGNYKGKIPSARAYYTIKNLITANKTGDSCVVDKDSDFDKIISALKKSKNNNVLICWEHNSIKKLIMAILGNDKKVEKKIPEYKDLIKKYKKIDLTAVKSTVTTYQLGKIPETFNSITINGENIELGDVQERDTHDAGFDDQANAILSFDEDVGFSIMYKLIIKQNKHGDFEFVSLKTYPNFAIEIDKNEDGSYEAKVTDFSSNYPYGE